MRPPAPSRLRGSLRPAAHAARRRRAPPRSRARPRQAAPGPSPCPRRSSPLSRPPFFLEGMSSDRPPDRKTIERGEKMRSARFAPKLLDGAQNLGGAEAGRVLDRAGRRRQADVRLEMPDVATGAAGSGDGTSSPRLRGAGPLAPLSTLLVRQPTPARQR